jgi:hypothetical protein
MRIYGSLLFAWWQSFAKLQEKQGLTFFIFFHHHFVTSFYFLWHQLYSVGTEFWRTVHAVSVQQIMIDDSTPIVFICL